MTGFTDRYSTEALNALVAEYPYIALFKSVGDDTGVGFIEVSGGSYARFATGSGDWTSPIGSAPMGMSNAFDFHFPSATGSWGFCIAWGLFDAPTSGNLGFWDYLGAFQWLEATVSAASPAIITTGAAHGISVADNIVFTNEYGGVSPSFSASNFTGLLAVAHAATATLDVTNSAIAVNTSTAGSGKIRKVTTYVIQNTNLPYFPAGQLTLQSA